MQVMTVLAITKTAAALSRLLGRGGGQALPGVLAETLDPHLAKRLASSLPHGVILVTGTNGKTTTTKLMTEILESSGEKVLTNSTGSNLKRGVTSALIAAADLRGRLRGFTVGLFEVDEASLRQVAPELMPTDIVVLNLFRDQLDRYGELDITAALIGQGIGATKARLYLNADDPLVASLAKYASSHEKVSYFGIEAIAAKTAPTQQMAADSDRCPVCHQLLVFTKVFYGHIGHYYCSNGHFARPQPTTSIASVEESDLKGSNFTASFGGKRTKVRFPLPGTYNLYNALAALSLASGWDLDPTKVAKSLSAAEAAFGRVEIVTVQGRTLYLLLIKNPAGFTQVLETFLAGRHGLNVLMAVNDLAADGRDVSWLWDVPLESLAKYKPEVVTSGIREADMAVRLHYAGIEAERSNTFEDGVSRLISIVPKGGTAYILPTYTAMLAIRRVLSKLTQIPEAG